MLRAAAFLLLAAATASAQRKDPVQWALALEPASAAPGTEVTARLTATIQDGWHLYSPTTPPGGPVITSVKLAESPIAAQTALYESKPYRKLDPNFNLETEVYDKQAVFLIRVRISKDAQAGSHEIAGSVRYQACSDTECLRPVSKTAAAKLIINPAAPAPPAFAAPADYIEVPARTQTSAKPPTSAPSPTAPASEGLGWFLLGALGLGVAAIFTPCVFPMIPITMSYFLNRPESSRGSVLGHAGLFSLGIVVLFTSIGLITSAILGPFGVIQLAANPWVNGFITVIFVAFAFSLLGAFEITLPSSVLTKLDSMSQRGGIFGTLLMGLTFSLTSFACVGPFVGSLLAASVQGDKLQPLLGMASFAVGLAAPFSLLALFPGVLKRMPRSGGWLATVKIVMGFVLLAVSLKYASNVDQVLRLEFLTRERFLAAWIVLFALPGLYLLGFLRLPGSQTGDSIGMARLTVGAVFLIFSISLVPGMFGGRLGDLDAYVPQGGASGFASAGQQSKLAWMKDQYREALARARAENKLVFLSFTGYTCTNCHWMKANMFTRPEISEALSKFVLVELYTDGVGKASEENQQLQEKKFDAVAIPYYAIVDADERIIATSGGATRDPSKFLTFLRSGEAPASALSSSVRQ